MTAPGALRGILLAGGRGTRLFPMTAAVSKHLLPVFNKPMIYYPLSSLIRCGAAEILLISTPEDQPRFRALLGDGSQWGISVEYGLQEQARGIAEALTIGAAFLDGARCLLALGDNLLHGDEAVLQAAVEATAAGAATIFGIPVREPGAYGVVEVDPVSGEPRSVEEKPARPRSPYAIPGLYVLGADASDIARTLRPSARGELEITDVHRAYLRRGRLAVRLLDRGFSWFDAGTPDGLLDASTFVHAVESRQGIVVGSPEEAALGQGRIDAAGLRTLLSSQPDGPYRQALLARLGDVKA